MYNGYKLKEKIRSKDLDSELGIDKIADTKAQEAFREALAKAAYTTTRKGKQVGEAKMWKELSKHE